MNISKDEEKILNIKRLIEEENTQQLLAELPRFVKDFEKLQKRTNKILKQSDTQQLEVLKLTEKLEDSKNRVNNLLNNAGEGFLYFDSQMKIGHEYSKEVFHIFEQDVADKSITELLYPDDNDKEMFVRLTLQGILQEDDFKQEILISLLDTEFLINNKSIIVQYKVLDSHTFMMILTDVTSQKELDRQVQEKQQILKMIVEVVITKEQFLEVKKDYEKFIERIDEYKSLEYLEDLRKEVHTYKGLFAQKEMLYVVDSLHEFETVIDKSLKKKNLDDIIVNLTKEQMSQWLDKDLDEIKEVLGEDYFSKKEYVEISKFRLENLHKEISEYEQTKSEKLFDKIKEDTKNLQFKNIKLFFRPYKKLVEQLAQTLEKKVYPLEEDIDNIYISDRFIPFINTLVHLFRNSVDHGIESNEKRYETSKDQTATVYCKVKKVEDILRIVIGDDGNGIDPQKIKAVLVEKELYDTSSVEKLSENEILMSIFKDSFSTSHEITKISGRGVGLASVLDELKDLNGKITLKNTLGEGIEFIFEIPFNQNML